MRTYGVTAVALLAGALIALSQYKLEPVDRALNMRWLRFFGRYSYGIYVFHVPIFLIASHMVTARRRVPDAIGLAMPLPFVSAAVFILTINAVSILLAVLSYQLVESRILRLKDRFKPKFVERSTQQYVAEPGRG